MIIKAIFDALWVKTTEKCPQILDFGSVLAVLDLKNAVFSSLFGILSGKG
jgi:hypothetical protein